MKLNPSNMYRTLRLVVMVGMLALPLLGLSISVHSTHASAGFMDTVKGIFHLPGKVDKLQNQYDDAKQQLDDANRQLDSVTRESKEAMQQWKDSEQKMLQETERLARQNEQLQQSIRDLQQAEQERSAKYRRTITMLGTAVGLVMLYFLLGRVLRVVLRSR